MITDKATASSGVSGGSTIGSTDGISGTDSDVENPEDHFEIYEGHEGLTFDEAFKYCSNLGLGFINDVLVKNKPHIGSTGEVQF